MNSAKKKLILDGDSLSNACKSMAAAFSQSSKLSDTKLNDARLDWGRCGDKSTLGRSSSLVEEAVDPRLKHFEPRMLERIRNEVQSHITYDVLQ